MDSFRLPLEKTLAAVSFLIVLSVVFAVACWADAPTPASTQPAAPPITAAPATLRNSTAGPPPAETRQSIPTPTLTPAPLRHPAAGPPPAKAEQTIPTPTLTPTPPRQDAAVPPPTAATTYPASTPATQPTLQHIPPPPIVGLDTGEGTVIVEPELLLLIINHATGGNEAPDELRVIILWDDYNDATTDFIASQGGARESDTYDPASRLAHLVWRIPVESMLAVLQHPRVWGAALWVDRQTELRERPDHPKLHWAANRVVTAWRLGVPAENAAQYAMYARGDSVGVVVEAGNGPDFQRLLTWLVSEDVYIAEMAQSPTKDQHGNVIGGWIRVLMPVSLIAEAAQRDEVQYIYAQSNTEAELAMQRHYWSLEALWLEDTMVDRFVPEDQRIGRPEPD